MHVAYCETFGVSMEDLLATPETSATSAYALYIVRVRTSPLRFVAGALTSPL